MRAENNPIALLVAIRDFLEGIKDVHIESFLADWPSANCITRSVLPHRLPVLSWLPAAVKAAGKNTAGVVKILAAQANGDCAAACALSLARGQPGPEITYWINPPKGKHHGKKPDSSLDSLWRIFSIECFLSDIGYNNRPLTISRHIVYATLG